MVANAKNPAAYLPAMEKNGIILTALPGSGSVSAMPTVVNKKAGCEGERILPGQEVYFLLLQLVVMLRVWHQDPLAGFPQSA